MRGLWLLPLAGCVHTAALPPLPEDPVRATVRADVINHAGEECLWEAEELLYDGRAVWTAEPPWGENWCVKGGEVGRMVDLGERNGPFLSTVLTTLEDDRWTTACVTWDLPAGRPATLEDYDEKHADKRWEQAVAAQGKDPSLTGWAMARDSFRIVGSHVAFCAIRGRDVRDVLVR